ncbi:hypothetical protein L484_007433 [Morus notabilis]|uniref:Uncharacterized protein n=1 Tax=Morus notabilis TaxID=981085 RepID=W9RMR6_9ROSA|nr:hypothetical protein L484_007433 [Morus notabilis]
MFDWRSGGCYLLVLCALVFLVWKLREKPGKIFRLLKGYFLRFVDVKFAHHMVDDDQGVNIWMTTRESTLVDNHAQDGMAWNGSGGGGDNVRMWWIELRLSRYTGRVCDSRIWGLTSLVQGKKCTLLPISFTRVSLASCLKLERQKV